MMKAPLIGLLRDVDAKLTHAIGRRNAAVAARGKSGDLSHDGGDSCHRSKGAEEVRRCENGSAKSASVIMS